MERPSIVEHDRSLEHLSPTVALPRRFSAQFAGAYTTTVEFEVVNGKPLVREVRLSTNDGDLSTLDLRVPLRGTLAPTAVKAACVSLVVGEPPASEAVESAAVEGSPDLVRIGAIRAYGRRESRSAEYEAAASSTLSRGRGRPRRVPDLDELRRIAQAFTDGNNSISALRRQIPMSRPTAYRRLQEARAFGLLNTSSPGGTDRGAR